LVHFHYRQVSIEEGLAETVKYFKTELERSNLEEDYTYLPPVTPASVRDEL
jgi:hypothetical protein